MGGKITDNMQYCIISIIRNLMFSSFYVLIGRKLEWCLAPIQSLTIQLHYPVKIESSIAKVASVIQSCLITSQNVCLSNLLRRQNDYFAYNVSYLFLVLNLLFLMMFLPFSKFNLDNQCYFGVLFVKGKYVNNWNFKILFYHLRHMCRTNFI